MDSKATMMESAAATAATTNVIVTKKATWVLPRPQSLTPMQGPASLLPLMSKWIGKVNKGSQTNTRESTSSAATTTPRNVLSQVTSWHLQAGSHFKLNETAKFARQDPLLSSLLLQLQDTKESTPSALCLQQKDTRLWTSFKSRHGQHWRRHTL